MAVAGKQDGKKWVQTGVAVTCILLSYISLSFFETLSVWFELESKIPYFNGIIQGAAGLVGLTTFLVVMFNQKTSTFLNEVFAELVKVVWPENSQTARMTVIVVIGVTIAGLIFSIFDFVANYLLSLIR